MMELLRLILTRALRGWLVTDGDWPLDTTPAGLPLLRPAFPLPPQPPWPWSGSDPGAPGMWRVGQTPFLSPCSWVSLRDASSSTLCSALLVAQCSGEAAEEGAVCQGPAKPEVSSQEVPSCLLIFRAEVAFLQRLPTRLPCAAWAEGHELCQGSPEEGLWLHEQIAARHVGAPVQPPAGARKDLSVPETPESLCSAPLSGSVVSGCSQGLLLPTWF